MGSIIEAFQAASYDAGILRPWLKDERSWVTLKNENGGTTDVLRDNLQSRLTKAQWAEIDKVVTEEFKAATPLVQFLLSQGLRFGSPRMSKTHLEPEVDEITEEDAEMKRLAEETIAEHGPPMFVLKSLPLPITHCNWPVFSQKPAKAGFDMDGLGICAPAKGPVEAASAVGEAVETAFVNAILGQENAKIMPVSDSPRKDVFDMKGILYENKFYGPYLLIHNTKKRFGSGSFPDGVEPVMILSRALPEGDIVMVQLTHDVIRAVVGLEPIAVQWEDGYKVMAIVVPQIRSSFDPKTGLCNNVGIIIGKPKGAAYGN